MIVNIPDVTPVMGIALMCDGSIIPVNAYDCMSFFQKKFCDCLSMPCDVPVINIFIVLSLMSVKLDKISIICLTLGEICAFGD